MCSISIKISVTSFFPRCLNRQDIGQPHLLTNSFRHGGVKAARLAEGLFYLERSFPGRRLYTPTNYRRAWVWGAELWKGGRERGLLNGSTHALAHRWNQMGVRWEKVDHPLCGWGGGGDVQVHFHCCGSCGPAVVAGGTLIRFIRKNVKMHWASKWEV